MELDFSRLGFVGRQDELNCLRAAFAQVSDSNGPCSRMVFIEGQSGTGKSALVGAFRMELSHEHVFCISGKFDEGANMTSEPFSALVDCLNELAAQLQQEKDKWRSILEEKASSDTRILFGLSPGFRELMGVETQRDAAGSSSSSHQDVDLNGQWGFKRLQVALRSVIRVVSVLCPIVFHLDDLQWADMGSLALLTTLLEDTDVKHVVFIATCREVGPDHPLNSSPLCTDALKCQLIKLDNLTVRDVRDMICSLTRRDASDVEPLAGAVHKRTDGNAFFAVEFVRMLYAKGYLYYDLSQFRWDWDLRRIVAETSVTDGVVDLTISKLRDLPADLQQLLAFAACLGSTRFRSHDLFHVMLHVDWCGTVQSNDSNEASEQVGTMEHVAALLDVGIRQGLLFALGAEGTYKFAHDRIKESAYELLPPKDDVRKRLHLRVGTYFRDKIHEAASDDAKQYCLLAFKHLNAGMDLMVDPLELVDFAALAYKAAELAFEKSSYFLAAHLLKTGLSALDEDTRWSRHYSLTLKLSTNLARVYWCCGDATRCRAVLTATLNRVSSFDDQLPLYRVSIECLLLEGKPHESLVLSLRVLDSLGVRLPRRNLKLHILRGQLSIDRMLRKVRDEEMLSLPPAKEKRKVEAVNFLEILKSVAMMTANYDYQVISVIQSVRLALQHGASFSTPLSIATFGALSAALRRFECATRYSILALKMIPSDNSHRDLRPGVVIDFFVAHMAMNKTYPELLDGFLRAIPSLLDQGDLDFAILAMVGYTSMYIHSGLSLPPLKDDIVNLLRLLRHYGQTFLCALFEPLVQLVLNLMGESDDPLVFTGDAMDQTEFESLWTMKTSRNVRAIQTLKLHRMILAYYLGDLRLARSLSCSLYHFMEEATSPFLCPRFLYQGLIAYGLAKSRGWFGGSLRREGRRYMRRLERFVKCGNGNSHHMVLLLQAEDLSLYGDEEDVRSAYDRAIVASGRLGFVHHQALGNELAGVYFLGRDEGWATSYLTRACSLYIQWGARAKVRQLHNSFREYLDESGRLDVGHSSSVQARSRLSDLSSSRSQLIDAI